MNDSYVSFSNKPPVEEQPSLAYRLGIGPNCRWITMKSGIVLTTEDNPDEYLQVHIAEKTRRGIVTDTETVYNSFTGKLAFGTV